MCSALKGPARRGVRRDKAQGAHRVHPGLHPAAAAMTLTESSDKVPIALVGPEDVEFCSPPVSAAWSAYAPQTGAWRGGPIGEPGAWKVGAQMHAWVDTPSPLPGVHEQETRTHRESGRCAGT